MMLKKINHSIIPDYIISIIKQFEHHGFEAYIVGGAVRDLFLGRLPKEYDITTNALPTNIVKIFKKTKPTGVKFGTIQVFFNSKSVEVTTYRKEYNYNDSRHPSDVVFTTSIHDDLKRRDFTINAMAFNPINDDLIDDHHGLNHLNEQRLICVGNPLDRFIEDSLRPFRCFRFIAQLGLTIDGTTRQALSNAINTPLPSIERIRSEMDRLLCGPYWDAAIRLMFDTGWLNRIIPTHSKIQPIPKLPFDLMYRWAWLFGSSSIDQLGQSLNFSKKDILTLKHIINWNFNEFAINLSIKDIQISSNELIVMGYTGKKLGQIQQLLLNNIRQETLENTYQNIHDFLNSL